MDPFSMEASPRSGPGFFYRSRNLLILQATVAIVWLWVVALGKEPITDCTADAGLTPVCGFSNPEDLVLLPGGEWLLVSQYAEDKTGSLVAFRPKDRARRMLWPRRGADATRGGLGDDECPRPPEEFEPHGVDLSPDGRYVVVVNHGGHESVEYFTLRWDAEGPQLDWDGCSLAPEGIRTNDVAALPDGGFLLTQMRSANLVSAGFFWTFGFETGFVWRWHADRGWGPVLGTGGHAPNGIAVSGDALTTFFAEWSEHKIVRVAADGTRSETPLSFRPDNLTWRADGRLMVAGQRASFFEVMLCGFVREGTCKIPSVVVAIDPQTMIEYPMLDHDPSRRLGAASSAVQVGDEFWIGTFKGDRLVAWRP